MTCIRLSLKECERKPAPAGDGCSDESYEDPFSQPSPAFAGVGVIEIRDNDLGKEVRDQVNQAKKLIDIWIKLEKNKTI